MNAPQRRIVMADVAAVAGVSPQTVSRVLSGSARVSDLKRRQVLAAVEALGYRPNLAARALASNKSGAIGVLVAARAHFGMVDTLVEVETAARAAGYFLVLAMEQDARADSVQGAYRYLEQRQVESIVVLAQSRTTVPVLQEVVTQTPTVLVLAGPGGLDDIATVGIEQRLGGRLAAEHLLSCGYRDLVHVTGDLGWQDALDRADGFREACLAAGVEPTVVEGRSWEVSEGFRAGRRLLAEGLPRAVFTGNDQMALGLLSALHEAGVRVPDDVAVMGFDDAPGSAWWPPPLSTVRQDFHALGGRVIEMVQGLLTGDEIRDERLMPQVVARVSTLGADALDARAQVEPAPPPR
ncbi:LacI family transcriptional regulator [Actinotalea sp. M2MS4P-6]|uniref:LacI family DNA-binding transcriptional regulator n=1 Tax=Actinotalea sp. M2MS4P-6 TaxID=2983762 RepID=UPI0021E46E2C|nr:LacI family DNA-binding transcriptional regulator [Actinotalea sp. M2MS4P-6]MCV2394251.1 LacI family transcriptional regulator [Actinotalea sp. M2MS4P-6]